jgi:C-terminal processing protease CtpA/Prc
VLANSRVYITAEKYDIQPLKLLATAKYKAAVVTLWNNQTFSESVYLIYSNTVEPDRSPRDVVAQTAEEHIKALLEKEEFMTMPKDHSDLSFDVIRKMAGVVNVKMESEDGQDD